MLLLWVIRDLSPWSMIQPSNNTVFLPTVTDLQKKSHRQGNHYFLLVI